MTIRHSDIILILLACLSVLPLALRAQGFPAVDSSPYPASSVYFVTLTDADGKNVNSQYVDVDRAIGGFVAGALRGNSQWQATGEAAGQGFFVIRVWGSQYDSAIVTFRLRNSRGMEQEIGTQPFSQGNEGTYGSPSSPIQLVVQEWVLPDVSVTFAVQELTVSKLRDTELLLTKDETAGFLPSLVELVFESAENGQPVAVATTADYTGLRWNVRGQYAGRYTARIRYNGKEQSAICRINVLAEYPIEPGWQWMSFYAIGSDGVFPLKSGNSWSPIQLDNDNYVTDIRTQQGVLHYDSGYGYIGNLEVLRAGDGAFKVRSEYVDDATNRIVLNAGYANLLKGSSLPNPKVDKGYTWVNYPHEVSLTIDAISPYLSETAADGDMLIGRDGFAEFNGEEWMTTSDFILTPGSGYIYYTEVPFSRSLYWGQALQPMFPVMTRRTGCAQTAAPWSYVPARYPDCMPVVARLQGIDSPEDYTIGAFVGDECRGKGEAAGNGLMFIAVSGQPGDLVTFRLYDKTMGLLVDMQPVTVSFSGHVGSYRNPLLLSPDMTGLHPVVTDQERDVYETYDLQGRRMASDSSTPSAHRQKGIYIITVTKGDHRETRKVICR